MRVYKFTAVDGSQEHLASRLKAAGHEVISVNDNFVVMRPFEPIDDLPFEGWVSDMQGHFRCELSNEGASRGVSR